MPSTHALRTLSSFCGHFVKLTIFGLMLSSALGQTVPKNNAAPLSASYAPGDEVVVDGHHLFVQSVSEGTMLLTLPPTPTQTLGAFITPVKAEGSSFQNGTSCTADRTIDGSGLSELFPGSGVWIHQTDADAGGNVLWITGGGDSAPTVTYDLGKSYNVNGIYFWNYNDNGNMTARGWKGMTVQSSDDKQAWKDVGVFPTDRAPGNSEYQGQAIPFGKKITARYFKLQSQGNFGDGQSGLSEIRFSNADVQAPSPRRGPWVAKYPRPSYPKLALGQDVPGGQNFDLPPSANIVDVTKAPYNAKGDGITDDTAAIQHALNDNPAIGAIIYLPNGRYIVSDTLKWGGPDDPHAGNAQKNTVLCGQSRQGTILQLKDQSMGYRDPRHPKAVIWTGQAPAQRFGNEVRHLTIDTGAGNRGAIGLQFIANNQGGVYDVRIVSGDGQGQIGLDLGYTDEQGPMLIEGVEVQGFDVGVSSSHSVASWTGENISLSFQNVVGLRNSGEPVSLRKLISKNDVPAIQQNAGLLTLIDSTLTGMNAAKDLAAIQFTGGDVFLRNVKTSGYQFALDDKTSNKTVSDEITEYASKVPQVLISGASTSLNLPIKETPEIAWGDPSKWAIPNEGF